MKDAWIRRGDVVALTPALFPDLRPIWMMMESAKRFEIPLRPFGQHQPYQGWVDIKIHKLIEETGKLLQEGIPYVIYTDGRDVFYTGHIDEILLKYEEIYGAPKLLQSSEAGIFESYESFYDRSLYPSREEKGHPYVFPGSCAFMGEVGFIYDQLTWMKENYPFGTGVANSMPDDDPAWWRRWDHDHADLIRNGTVKFDYDCQIFQNAGNTIDGGGQFDVALEIVHGRPYNRLTKSLPCMLHFNGGYSHALMGKIDSMMPVWRALGYTSNPPWEAE